MRLYTRPYDTPSGIENISIVDFHKFAIDRKEFVPIGFVINYDVFTHFEIGVYGMEGDNNPYDSDLERAKPSLFPTGGSNPSYQVSYRGMMYAPGTAPQQDRRMKLLSSPSIFEMISNSLLTDLLAEIAPWTDPSGFTTEQLYENIIKDGGAGTQVRYLVIDGRDLSY